MSENIAQPSVVLSLPPVPFLLWKPKWGSSVNVYAALKSRNHLQWRWQLGERVNFSYRVSVQDTEYFSAIYFLEMSNGDVVLPAAENSRFGRGLSISERLISTHKAHTRSWRFIQVLVGEKLKLKLLRLFTCTRHARTHTSWWMMNNNGDEIWLY